MNLRLIWAMIAIATLLAQGCCPIPVPMTKPLMHKGEIIVRHHSTQKAVADAQVRISRGVRHPHPGDITHEWDLTTDQNGSVQTSAKSHTEWQMPLMMHGVSFYYWRVCVAKPGYKTVFKHWASENDKTLKPFVIALVPGDHTPCPTKSREPVPMKDSPLETPSENRPDNPIIQIKDMGARVQDRGGTKN